MCLQFLKWLSSRKIWKLDHGVHVVFITEPPCRSKNERKRMLDCVYMVEREGRIWLEMRERGNGDETHMSLLLLSISFFSFLLGHVAQFVPLIEHTWTLTQGPVWCPSLHYHGIHLITPWFCGILIPYVRLSQQSLTQSFWTGPALGLSALRPPYFLFVLYFFLLCWDFVVFPPYLTH